MKRILLYVLLILSIVLASCSATAASIPSLPLFDTVTRIDQQGAIVIEITPLNLDSPTDTLEFDVIMDTHSIDLSMDLATLATLSTDTGVMVPATLWDAPRGGHHLVGKLIFPAMQDGKLILEGATKLTLTILNVNAPIRIFEWVLK